MVLSIVELDPIFAAVWLSCCTLNTQAFGAIRAEPLDCQLPRRSPIQYLLPSCISSEKGKSDTHAHFFAKVGNGDVPRPNLLPNRWYTALFPPGSFTDGYNKPTGIQMILA